MSETCNDCRYALINVDGECIGCKIGHDEPVLLEVEEEVCADWRRTKRKENPT